MKKYAIIDTESNGTETFAEVWQVAWQVTDCHFLPLMTDAGYLNPISRMKPNASRITRLDRNKLKQLAEPADELYGRLLKSLRGCKAIIGHSVWMDIERLINDAERRCSRELAEKVKTALKAIPDFDTAAKTVEFVGKKRTRTFYYHGQLCMSTEPAYPSLTELARKLMVSREGLHLHSADGDVELTRRCMAEMKMNHRRLLKDLTSRRAVNPGVKIYND